MAGEPKKNEALSGVRSETSVKHLKEVASVFLKLGFLAFGGPVAHIAMMQDEIVEKRKWVSQQHFLDLVGATNLIPGPNSTEMTMHLGKERAGWAGLFVGGACFIGPAVIITLVLAWLYVDYGNLPQVAPFLYGIKPAVLAIIIGAVWKLGKKAIKNAFLAILGAAVMAASYFGMGEAELILGAGVMGILWKLAQRPPQKINSLFPLAGLPFLTLFTGKVSGSWIFFYFLKVGTVLFGGGYVLVAYLEGGLVETGMLTRTALLDAIAIGQFTPGPVLSTATFIGYELQGFRGAFAATLGIFLPSFFFVLLLNPVVPKLRKSVLASGFLNAVNAGALGVMAMATGRIGWNSVGDWKTALIAALAIALVLIPKKVSVIWIVLGGALLGYVLQLF